MATTIQELAEQAMKLPGESHAQLADLLVESLAGNELTKIDQLWLAEAKRRRDEIRAGAVEAIPGEEALKKCPRLPRPMRYNFHPEALDEYFAATNWYRNRDPELGQRSVTEVENSIATISQAPNRWPTVEDDVRRCLTHVFLMPFSTR